MNLIQSSLSQKKRDVVFPLLIFHHDCVKVDEYLILFHMRSFFVYIARNDRVLSSNPDVSCKGQYL